MIQIWPIFFRLFGLQIWPIFFRLFAFFGLSFEMSFCQAGFSFCVSLVFLCFWLYNMKEDKVINILIHSYYYAARLNCSQKNRFKSCLPDFVITFWQAGFSFCVSLVFLWFWLYIMKEDKVSSQISFFWLRLLFFSPQRINFDPV